MTNNNIIFTNGTIKGMEAFADTIKCAMEAYYGEEYKVNVQKVVKNNNTALTGLVILNPNVNIAPTIYLESFYERYKAGTTMADICQEIIRIYEEHSLSSDFDITLITDFNTVKNNLYFKLVNAGRNKEMLSNAPHKVFLDLAIVYYVKVFQNKDENGVIQVHNQLLQYWNIDNDTLFDIALHNTQQEYRGRVTSMFSMISELMDEEFEAEFFDMAADKDVPMYVATNRQKYLGANVTLYPGLLRSFARQIGESFYILPSSTHEMLFVPISAGLDEEYLKEMVQSVNETEVSEQEFLSNNIYYYSLNEDRMVIV